MHRPQPAAGLCNGICNGYKYKLIKTAIKLRTKSFQVYLFIAGRLLSAASSGIALFSPRSGASDVVWTWRRRRRG